jgi:hypothetical protein
MTWNGQAWLGWARQDKGSFMIEPMRPIALPENYLTALFADEYIAQPKYNGWYIVFHRGRAYTRHGVDLTDWKCFRNLPLPESATGEMLHIYGIDHIHHLQLFDAGLRIVLFDVPSTLPIEKRLAQIPTLADKYGFECAPLIIANTWDGYRDKCIESIGAQNEGIVLKLRGSLWEPGESKAWRKMKKGDL